MGMKKTTSLKASFWKFLYMLLIGLIGAVAIPFSLILAGTSTGLLPMRIIQNATQKILLLLLPQRRILADVQLPMGCKYLVLDKKLSSDGNDLRGRRFGPGYGIRNIREDKFKPQQTVFVCDPQK